MTTCAPCMQQSPGGSDDQDTRNAACWWTLDVLELGHGGRCCQGFGIGAGQSATSDANLANAAQAVMSANINWGGACAADPTVSAFQTAWNATPDPNMWQATSGVGTLTVDGKYGSQTAAALAAATGGQSPTACTSFTGGGGSPASYSAAVVAAATAG